MILQRVYLESFRNLALQNVELSHDFTLVIGANGSGKTSFLEALFFLGTGRSFRTRKSHWMITNPKLALGGIDVSAARETEVEGGDESTDSGHLVVSGRLYDDTLGTEHQLGLRRSKDSEKLTARFDSEAVKTTSDLARLVPAIVIEPGNIQLVSGNPSDRRKYLDWGVFHVEHQFSLAWKYYQLALKQRNALLRNRVQDPAEYEPWHRKLAETGCLVSGFREVFLTDVQTSFERYLSIFLPTYDVKLNLKTGWGSGVSTNTEALYGILNDSLYKDLNNGHSSVGAHRMDVRITCSGRNASDVLSRGQTKLVSLALYFSALEQVVKKGITPLVLIDDLTAELDPLSCQRVIELLSDFECQVVVTSLDESVKEFIGLEKYAMFHVEHGELRPVS